VVLGARQALRHAFRMLYRSRLNTSQALEALERSVDVDEVRELAVFLRASKRGVCRYARTQAAVDELAPSVGDGDA
jgi:UDP-N-acetylglucosamine acyltransferase